MGNGDICAAGLVGLLGLAWFGAKCGGCNLGPIDGAYHTISEFIANGHALSAYVNPNVAEVITAAGVTIGGFGNMGYQLNKRNGGK